MVPPGAGLRSHPLFPSLCWSSGGELAIVGTAVPLTGTLYGTIVPLVKDIQIATHEPGGHSETRWGGDRDRAGGPGYFCGGDGRAAGDAIRCDQEPGTHSGGGRGGVLGPGGVRPHR